MKLPTYNNDQTPKTTTTAKETTHTLFGEKKITCLFKDNSVGFRDTTNCVQIENMHIREVFIVQVALDDTLYDSNISTCRRNLPTEPDYSLKRHAHIGV